MLANEKRETIPTQSQPTAHTSERATFLLFIAILRSVRRCHLAASDLTIIIKRPAK